MESLSALPLGQIYHVSQADTFDLTINLALDQGLRLLVCGNRLPFYDLAYALANLVGQHYETILKECITFSRAETCTQLVDFLSEIDATPTPLLVTDFLARFKDEADDQVDELFFACQLELERLSKTGLVLVSATARPPLERLGLVLRRVTSAVGAIPPTALGRGSHCRPAGLGIASRAEGLFTQRQPNMQVF